jgi:hypothetical protein
MEQNQSWWMNTKAYGVWAPFRGRGGAIYMQQGELVLTDTAHNDQRMTMFAVLEDGCRIELNNVKAFGGSGYLRYGVQARGPGARCDFNGPIRTNYGQCSPIFENVGTRPSGILAGVAGAFGSSYYGAPPSPFIFACMGGATHKYDWLTANPHEKLAVGTSPWTNPLNFPAYVTATGTGLVFSIGGNALPTGIHFAGPIVVPPGAVLSWTGTPTAITYAGPLGREFSPINSHGNAIGNDRYVVPMTGSTGNVTVDTTADVDLTIQGYTVAGSPPWVDSTNSSGAANTVVGRITFAENSDSVADYAITPYGAGGSSPTTFGDLGAGSLGSGASGMLHTMMGMEFKLVTVPAADGQTGIIPGQQYVRICPTLCQGGTEVIVNGGTSNLHGCARNLHENHYAPVLPSGPTYAEFNCTGSLTSGSTTFVVTAADHPLINGTLINGPGLPAYTFISSGPGTPTGTFTLSQNSGANVSGGGFSCTHVDLNCYQYFGQSFSYPYHQQGNYYIKLTGGTGVQLKAGMFSGYLRLYDNDCNLVNYYSHSTYINLGSGGGTALVLQNNDSQDVSITYTTPPTVDIFCATPSGVVLWPGRWTWVPIYTFYGQDFQYGISLCRKYPVPIQILYRKFSYLRMKHSDIARFNKFFEEGAWW